MSLVSFPAADGRILSGRLRTAEEPQGVAMLCHPHPAFGGNMDVWLLPVLSRALAEAGWTTLRFDFRPGADSGAEEDFPLARADAAGALRFVRSQAPAGGRCAAVGWSFGALVALLAGLEDPAVTDWVGIAPPTVPLDEPPLGAVPTERIHGWPARRTVVVGEHDQFFPPRHADAVLPHGTIVLPGADHFLFDRDREVAAAVMTALLERP